MVFVSYPTRADIIGAYQTANVLVFPTNNSDGFGIPLIEAGAAKCPVITTNIGPAPELIRNNETGILTAPNNLSELTKAILKIITNEKLEKKMGLNGFQNVVKNYSWENITDMTLRVYQEIL